MLSNKVSDRAEFIQTLWGIPIQEAKLKVAAKWPDYGIRIVKEDGKPKLITHDLRSDRINFEVEDGFVLRAYVG